jgi:hypothetical protein
VKIWLRLLIPSLRVIVILFAGLWVFNFILVNLLGFQEITGQIVALLLAGSLLFLVEFSFIYLQTRQSQKNAQRAAQFMLSKGVEIEKRIHPVTFIDTEPKYYEEASDPCYVLRHRFPKVSSWSLHKTRSGQGNLANGWKLIVKDGDVSGNLRTAIEAIARDETWSEKSLEIWCDSEKVWAFWDDGHDGLKIAQKVFDVLTLIAETSEN